MIVYKEIRWVGNSKDELLKFPAGPRKDAGFQLRKIQAGLVPDDWKPLDNIGAGIREIRIHDGTGIYRVLYVAKFEEAVYVLHSFVKKSQQIPKLDKDIAETRYKSVVRERKAKK